MVAAATISLYLSLCLRICFSKDLLVRNSILILEFSNGIARLGFAYEKLASSKGIVQQLKPLIEEQTGILLINDPFITLVLCQL